MSVVVIYVQCPLNDHESSYVKDLWLSLQYFFPEHNTELFQRDRDDLILKMVEVQKLPKRLVEAYGKVLEELDRGVPLKDDTYL